MSFFSSAPRDAGARLLMGAMALAPALVSTSPVHAEPGPRAEVASAADDGELKGQVISATRTAARVDAVVADVTVIDRAQLAASAGLSLAQVLARQPGVQLSTNGGLGKNSTLFLRGGQARYTLVLVDGVRFGSATTGAPSLENFPLEAIERIEIVRGPMAALHGSDAVSGVIQVFTRRGHEGAQLEGSVAVGSEEYRRVTAGWSGGSADWQGALTLSDQATQGFSATNPGVESNGFHPDRDGFRQQSVQASLMHPLVRDWRLRWQGVLSVGENELDDGYPARNRGLNTRSEVRSSLNSFSLSGRILPQWRSEWRAGHAYDSSNTTVAQLASRLGRIATTQRQLSWENQVALPLGSALVALDHVEQSVVSTTRYPVRHRTLNGLVLGWSGELGPHAWQLSTRHDHNSQYGDQPTAAAAYGYEVSPGWRVGASWGSTFSAPTFNDLYFPGRGNPNMPPQEGINKELSLTHTRIDGRWRAAFHRNDVRGYIQSSATQVLSIAEVRIQGVSVSADQAWDAAWGRWQLHGSADWLDAVDVATGKSLRRRAHGVFQGELSLQQGAWRHALGATVRDGAFDDDTNTAAKRLGGIGLLHASTRWQLAPEWALALRVDNLTDRRYQTAWGYNQARRQWFLTLSHSPRQGL